MNWIRAHIRILSLALLGSLLGALGGLLLGRNMLLRAANASLAAYALELTRNADALADEVNTTFSHLNTLGPSPCSDPDLQLLKAWTFRSAHVKDIGRTHHNQLFCSAFLGRLTHPYLEGPPSLALPGGLNVYTDVPVLVASTNQGLGTIIEAADLDVVLNADAFGNWDRPHLTYMVVAVNRETARMVRIAGSPIVLDVSTLLVQRSYTLNGSVLQSVCSAKHPACVVTAEHLADLWSSTRSTQITCSALGGFAGLSLGLIVFLFHKRATSLTHQLQRALRRDSPSLSLVYQPIIDLASGRCTGAEALLRWQDINNLPIAPDVFIPLAEEAGFIHQLTALVVRRATRELLPMLIASHDFSLSLNIAAADLAGEQLFRILHQHVVLAGIHPSQIALELTERSTADLAMVSASIERLCALSYKVHIDDFGVGFSSLSYIDQLQVNAIKIDRTFTRTIGTDAVIAPILTQMLDLAKSLGVDVIVEGVETELQRDFLAASGMPLRGQGWYFSRPLTVQDLRAFEDNNKALASSRHELGPALSDQPVTPRCTS